jgi:anti-sigma factor RsiW
MIDRNTPVTEDELHAYVDGELPADRRDAVEAWLATHQDDAALVAAWRAQAEAVRSRYGAVISQPVPDRLKLEKLARNRWTWVGAAAATVLLAFLIGGVTGWMARGASAAAPKRMEQVTQEALSAHRLYINENRHPIEVGATEDHLLPWLSRRVGTTLRSPDLTSFGLKLLGGRLLPGIAGPAALFMYEGNGERITLYCSKLAEQNSSFRYNEVEPVAAVQWIDGGYAWVVSGPANKMRLKGIARAAYDQQLDRAPSTTRSSAEPLVSRNGG